VSKRRILNLIALVVGIVVMTGIVREVGWDKTIAHIESVGIGFLLMVGIGLSSLFLDAWVWRLAFGFQVPLLRLVFASLAGSAVNAFTPLGEGGELVKANLLADVAPGQRVVSSVLMWNLVYRITKHVMIFAGPILLFIFESDRFGVGMLAIFLAACVVATIPTVIYFLALRTGGALWTVRLLRRIPFVRNHVSEDLVGKARETDHLVWEFATVRRDTTVRMLALGLVARLLGILEVYTVLQLLGAGFNFVETIFLVSGVQVVRIVISISPVQIGIAEAGETGLFALLGLPIDIGFAQAFVRLMRQLLFNALGLAYLGVCGIRKRRVTASHPR